jgi:glutathione S-transferase
VTGDPQLFHIALPEDLEAAERSGEYLVSTRGMTVAEVGFVHLSYDHQYLGVLERFYADRPDAVVLVLDPDRLGAEVREEPGEPGGELFPHLYGPLPMGAVMAKVYRRFTDPSDE